MLSAFCLALVAEASCLPIALLSIRVLALSECSIVSSIISLWATCFIRAMMFLTSGSLLIHEAVTQS